MSEPCALWCLLMKKFAIGKLSAVEVQQLAAAAVKSGATSAEMRELQSLGSMGTCPGNCFRDMQRKYFRDLAAPAPWKITCSMMLKQDGERVSSRADCHLLLPHLLQEANLLESLTCTASDLVTFWKSQKHSVQMKQNPGLFESLDFEHPSLLPVPYILHGDGAPFTEVDSIQVISFRSMGCFRFFHLCAPPI